MTEQQDAAQLDALEQEVRAKWALPASERSARVLKRLHGEDYYHAVLGDAVRAGVTELLRKNEGWPASVLETMQCGFTLRHELTIRVPRSDLVYTADGLRSLVRAELLQKGGDVSQDKRGIENATFSAVSFEGEPEKIVEAINRCLLIPAGIEPVPVQQIRLQAERDYAQTLPHTHLNHGR